MKAFSWALLLGTVMMPGLAGAQTINVDQATLFNRLDRMERRLMALEQKMFASGSGSMNQGNTGDYEIRLQEIERESTNLYGSVEEMGNALDRLAKRLDKMSQDIEMRLQDLEKNAAQPAAAPAVPGGQTSALESDKAIAALPPAVPKAIPEAERPKELEIPDDISPNKLYKTAYNYMTAAQYPVAQEWLETFLQRFPEHELADNAYYWLGEVHLVQGKADKAVIAFKDGLAKFPKGMKAPGNLLKMGVALQQLGQQHHARSAWKKLLDDYPESSEAAKAKAYLETNPNS